MKRIFSIFILTLLLLSPGLVFSAMQSDSYIIYENIHHSFDGPVISGIASSVSDLTATITWTTDVPADSFVVYSTDPTVPLSSSMEKGNGQSMLTSHSVLLSGLSATTVYYYRVKSTRINGGTTIDSAINSFTTGADPNAPEPGGEEEPAPSGGGGILIIDKTDLVPPVITNVSVVLINSESVRVTWDTDEEATSFVEYGQTLSFGSVYGKWDTLTAHEVVVENLTAGMTYNIRALSSDSWGNLGASEIISINLETGETEEVDPEDLETPEEPETPTETETPAEPEGPGIIESSFDFLRRLFPVLSLNQITDEQLGNIESMQDLENYLSAPVLSGQPVMNIGATEATISWQTDLGATSQIAYAPEDSYKLGALEPYYQVVGSSNIYTTEHEVTIHGLTPDTTYHFQIRSKPEVGPTALSRDYTFATKLEDLSIVSFFSQIVDNQTAVFKWVTNKEADSTLRFAPYHNNVLAIDEQKTYKDNNITVIHEITVTEFEAGISYDVEIESTDREGNTAQETLLRFTTSEDDLPPVVSHVKADSTVFLDRSNKTQTIISWLTNEPSTSRVFYQEGVHGSQIDLAETTDLNTNYTKEHIMVITKFKPGVVYSFRVESTDSGGNTSVSKTHTFMTAKQRESIIQIIIKIFEDTFGWVKKLM